MSRMQLNSRRLSIILVGFIYGYTGAESSVVSSSINWHSNYAKAQQRRAKEQRPMLVFVMSDHCSHCHRMLASTYLDTAVVREVQREFVPTLVNASKNARLASAFKVTVYPTTFLVGPDNKIVDRIEGYVDGNALRKRIAIHSQRNRVANREK